MQYQHPEFLTDCQSLQQRLQDDNLRLFDCAVFLTPTGNGRYQVDSGRSQFDKEHIPGAGFIDLVSDWADKDSDLNFTLPNPASLQQAIGNSGITADNDVVLYSSGHLMWATRAWWLLHYAGHQRISILNGNLNAWRKAGLALESGPGGYPSAVFQAPGNPQAFADTEAVLQGMDGKVCTVNALSKPLYEGSGDFYYQRRGHIPGSHLLYFDEVLDNEYFLPAQALHDTLDKIGMLSAEQVITYCGGGIAATLDAFAAKLLGQQRIAVYDGSMSEWVQDENRPLTIGPDP